MEFLTWKLKNHNILIAIVIWVFSLSQPAMGFSEDEVKGAYLSKFGEFVEWPPGTFPGKGAPLVIGIFEGDSVSDYLDIIAKTKIVSTRSIIVLKITKLSQIQDAQILYISQNEMRKWSQIKNLIKNKPILTVVEKGFGLGPMICFTNQNNKIRFEIDLDAVKNANLRLSSELINLAVNIKRSDQ